MNAATARTGIGVAIAAIVTMRIGAGTVTMMTQMRTILTAIGHVIETGTAVSG
jgi:hypothetical protein